MNRFVVMAPVILLALSAANCAEDGANPGTLGSSSLVAPSAPIETATPISPNGKGGGGGKGSGGTTGGSGSLTLVMVTDLNGNGSANWGDTVTFNVTTSALQPNVDLKCTQNGTVVYGATTGFYDSYPWPWTRNMTLSSTSWQSGAASCTARLYVFSGSSTTTLATTSFTAGA